MFNLHETVFFCVGDLLEGNYTIYFNWLFVNSWGGILQIPPHCCVGRDFDVLIEK